MHKNSRGCGVNIQSVAKSIVFGGHWYAEKRTYKQLLQKKIPGKHASDTPPPQPWPTPPYRPSYAPESIIQWFCLLAVHTINILYFTDFCQSYSPLFFILMLAQITSLVLLMQYEWNVTWNSKCQLHKSQGSYLWWNLA